MKVEIFNKKSSNFFEVIFVSSFWVLLFTAPLIFQCINKPTINWNVIFNVWTDYLPLLVIFCINRCFLIPYFLFKSRLYLYLISVTSLIIVTVISSITIRKQFNPQQKAPLHNQALLQFPNSNKAIHPKTPKRQEIPLNTTPPYINLILLSILLVGFDTGMRFSVKWAQSLQQKAEIEKENIKNELAFLRNQISPHFLMNTLNNIHSLVDFDTIEAKSAIAKLSVLMRHLLYETDTKFAPLSKEINFIESYIQLMKLRYSDEIEIKLILPKNIPNILIPPLLFTNTLENVFKYGISYEKKSFVKISMLLHKNELEFCTFNSVHKNKKTQKSSGIGIKNTEKRLKLLYDTNYTFTNTENENVFISIIKIPI